MRLIIFDVDGTLTDTIAVDARCFLRTFVEVCDFVDVDPDWSRYKNATDAGIFHEVFLSRNGRPPAEIETTRFRDHLVRLFRYAAGEARFSAIAGAPQLLARLDQSGQYKVALATGCWRESARVKMASAGMDYDVYPSASADDAPDREAIIQLVVERAAARYRGLEGSVYVGDGVWDARACRTLGIPFIGIGRAGQADKLLEEGAVRIFGDLADSDHFFRVLQNIEA
jgi:phosphoglycolate phosphatase-like HAD superfamily hydrolase